jgi:hypothetical protein
MKQERPATSPLPFHATQLSATQEDYDSWEVSLSIQELQNLEDDFQDEAGEH